MRYFNKVFEVRVGCDQSKKKRKKSVNQLIVLYLDFQNLYIISNHPLAPIATHDKIQSCLISLTYCTDFVPDVATKWPKT